VALGSGCSRKFWRQQADRDVYRLLNRKRNDPRWDVPRIDITPDPRSRFYDPYDPDIGPLPPDDPAAGRYMLQVAGKKGYKSWHEFGRAFSIENPNWLEPYGLTPQTVQQLSVNGEPSSVQPAPEINDLSLNEAIELSYLHDREYQTEIENVYLRALELTFERFQFDVRYLDIGGSEPSADLEHSSTPNGPNNLSLDQRIGVSQLLPSGAQLAVELANNTLWLFSGPDQVSTASAISYSIVQPLLFQAGRKIALENLTQSERNVLYAVRDLARFRKTFFTDVVGGPSGFLVVLRQAQLVQNERDNVRRVREQLETLEALSSQITVMYFEELPELPAGITFPPTVAGQIAFDAEQQRLYWRGAMTPAQEKTLLSLSNDPAWQKAIRGLISRRIFEPLDALPEGLTIPPTLQPQLEYSAEENRLYWKGPMNEQQQRLLLSLSDDENWQRAASALANRLRAEILTQDMLQLQSRLLRSQNSLRAAEQNYQDALDRFKISLGLPPNLNLTIDRSMLRQFQLIDPRVFRMEQRLKDFVIAWAQLDEYNPDEKQLHDVLNQLQALGKDVDREVLQLLQSDLQTLQERLPQRLERAPSPQVRNRVRQDVDRDAQLLQGLHRNLQEIRKQLDHLDDRIALPRVRRTLHAGIGFAGALPRVLSRGRRDRQRAAVRRIAELREDLLRITRNAEVVQIGLRAELISIAPFDLSIEDVVELSLQHRLDLKNARGRVMDARRQVEIAANRLQAVLNLRVEGDIETPTGNNPVDFRGRQSNFRVGVGFTAPLDLVNERNAFRDAQIAYQRARRDYMALEDQIKLEVRDSWRELEVLRQNFETARQAVRIAALQFDVVVENTLAPGEQQGRNAGLNLLNALGSVLDSQNDLIRIWVDYERSRLNIYRDMGIMEVDSRGLWNDPYYQRGTRGADDGPSTPPSLPPLPEPANRRSHHDRPSFSIRGGTAAGSDAAREDPLPGLVWDLDDVERRLRNHARGQWTDRLSRLAAP